MNAGEGCYIKEIPLFSRMVQPLGMVEKEDIRNRIKYESDPVVIHTWRGNHLEDKEKYEMCKEMDIPVKITELFFDDWMDAAIFICSKQLKRNVLTNEYKKYLIGSLLHYSMVKQGDVSKSESKTDISNEIGKEYFISGGTVQKYNQFSEAVNYIFEASDEMGRRILLNKTRISHENTIELSRLSNEEIRAISSNVIEKNIDYISLSYIRNEVKWSHVQEKDIVSRRERKESKYRSNAGIRKMPEYNPDSEVNSLCMTIDSWISSIERVKKSENFTKITEKASLHLMNKLTSLEHTISNIQELLIERKSV